MSGIRFIGAVLLVCVLSACGSSDNSIDFGAGMDPSKPAPRGRPYPCPGAAPEPRSVCTTRGLSCEYSQGTCICAADPLGAFGALAWNCPFDASGAICPDALPEADSPCTSLLDAAPCSYGQHVACHCSGETQAWACWDPANCPNKRPAANAACGPIGLWCAYDDTSCECFGNGFQCADAI